MPDKPDMRKSENKDLLDKVKERFKVMYDADHENRTAAMDDMKFVNIPGYQWDSNMKQERGKRPCYEFNKLRIKGKRIINGLRANRPGVKVRGTEDSDKEGAELREGLIRNIWSQSDADSVIDYEAEYQVNGGMGAWRVDTEYTDDDSFDQDIVIRAFENPFTVFCDPSAKDFLKRDADDWCITTRMTLKEFEAKYPKAAKTDFSGDMSYDDDQDWQDDETVRVAEYWYKTPTVKTLLKLDSGEVVDADSDEGLAIQAEQPEAIVGEREVNTHKIQYCIASGARILEGPHDWAGRMFPFVMVYGEYIVIDGKPQWCGLVRWAKDPQRSYNVSRTAITETIAQAPLSKWWATPKQAAGLTKQWSEAHKKNLPFMLYNSDPKTAGPPQRMGGADVPVALIQEAQLASEELKDVTGIYDASIGARSNEVSGRAIFARQSEGEIVNFNFEDNMSKGVQRTYEILMDLIPEIYDTERELRVLGADGAEDYFRVNRTVVDMSTGVPRPIRIHDLSAGKYDVTVTQGPSFSTKRQEAAELYTQLIQQIPDIMGVAGDLVFKAMDIPYAEEIAERMRFLLPPPVQESLKKDLPPEVASVMAQAEAAMQQAAAAMQEAGVAKQEAEAEISKAREAKANVGTDAAKLEAKWAKFEKLVAEELRKLAEMKAEIAPVLAGADDTNAAAAKVDEMRDVVDKLDEIVAKFMLEADQVVEDIEGKADRRIVAGDISRAGGKLHADIAYDDGSKRRVTAVREGDKLRLLPEDESVN